MSSNRIEARQHRVCLSSEGWSNTDTFYSKLQLKLFSEFDPNVHFSLENLEFFTFIINPASRTVLGRQIRVKKKKEVDPTSY